MKKHEKTSNSTIAPQLANVIADSSSVLLWIANVEKECIYFNKAWLNYTGRTLSQEYGFGWAEGVHKADYQRCIDIYNKAFDERQSFSMDYRLQKADGSFGWIQDDGAPCFDEAGQFQGYVGSCFDITKQKDLVAAFEEQRLKLESSNLRLRESVKAAQFGVFDWNIKSDLLEWDEQMFHIFGIPQSEDVNSVTHWENTLHPEDKERTVNALKATIEGLGKYNLDFRIIRRDGEIRIIKGDATVIRNSSGEPVRLLGINQDVTEERLIEAKIRGMEKRNRALLDHSPVSHMIIDLNFKLTYMNGNGFKIFNLPADDFIYGKPFPFDFFTDSAKPIIQKQLSLVVANKKLREFETLTHDSKGDDLWLFHTLIPVFKDDDNELDYLTLVSADITRQKETQEQLKHREKMDAIGQLAGGVAHDFNNQLASILGYAELLISEVHSDKGKNYAAKIITAAERSGKLTKQMLNYSRKQTLLPEAVDIHLEIQETLDLLSHSIDKRISVYTELSAEPSYVKGDKSHLQSAFLNLAINASDAMHDGGTLTIITDNVEPSTDKLLMKQKDVTPGQYIRIEFRDNGPGISESELTKVFEPFYTTKAIGKGTGMGLASVYGTVKQHAGYISVDSEVNLGTSFYLYLPKIKSIEEPRTKVLGSAHNEKTEHSQKKILVVDDEDALRSMCNDMLRALGYKVILAANGKEAVDIYRNDWKNIDLVLLDLAMPVMSGADAYDELKKINHDVRVIISSGYDADSSSNGLKSKGVKSFIEKPFRLDDLATKVLNELR